MDLSRLNPLAHIRSVNRYRFFRTRLLFPSAFIFFFQRADWTRDARFIHLCALPVSAFCAIRVERAYANTVFFFTGGGKIV